MSPDTHAQAAEAVSEDASHASVAVVHPGTGELLPPLQEVSSEALADALLALREHETEVHAWRKRVEAELGQRMYEHGRGLAVFGEFEVRMRQSRESVWDAEELELTLQALKDEGTIDAREATGIISREPTVSRKTANALLDRLTGRARASVEACRSWRTRSSATLEVTRSQPLLGERKP